MTSTQEDSQEASGDFTFQKVRRGRKGKRGQAAARWTAPSFAPHPHRADLEQSKTPEQATALLSRRREIVLGKRRLLDGHDADERTMVAVAECVRKALGDQSAAEDERWATISQSAVRSADSLRPAHILHLGLGSVKDNRIAQFQLGFLLLLRDQLGGEACSVQGFDPIWTKEDTDLLGSFGLTCLSKNEQGSYVLEQPTLVYMPHCGRSLYESILRANWSIKGLQNLLLCSNGFDKYAQLSNDLKRKAPCMHRILSHLHVMPLPSIPAPNHDSLNDLVFQRFAPTLQAAERQSREGSANASSVDGLAAHMRHTLSLDPPITPWKPGFWELPPLDPQQLGKDPELQ